MSLLSSLEILALWNCTISEELHNLLDSALK